MSAVEAEVVGNDEFSTIWVREAVRTAVLDAILADVPVAKEKVEVRVKPGFDTACWSYRPPHRVYVGDGIPKKAKPGLSTEEMQRYVASYVNHEFAHALYSERDLKSVAEDLKEIAPFRLFNLFEDARIEHQYRVSYDFEFGWTRYEEVSLSADQPTSVYFAFVQFEGDREAIDTLAAEAGAGAELVDEVEEFYRRSIRAVTSQALYPVLQEWVERFGMPEKFPGMDDLPLALELQLKPELQEAFDEESSPINTVKPKLEDTDPKGQPLDPYEGNRNLLAGTEAAIDEARVSRTAKRLERVFMQEERSVTTDIPSKRVSVRHFVLDRPFYRRKAIHAKRRRKVLIVVDCSGSMGGEHIEEGRILVAALSRLAKAGHVSGHVVLSAVMGSRACWQRFELPMSKGTIARIQAIGQAEGLENSLHQNLKFAREADFVFVYTDAQICDEPINKRALHTRGVYTWGLYVGGTHVLEDLGVFFDKAIVRSSAENLVEAMLTF